jgi:hypothetical protein
VHATDEDDAGRVTLLEESCRPAGDRKGVAAHVHEQHVVRAELSGQTSPRPKGTDREQIGLDAVLVQDCAKQPEPVILPPLERARG